jgi:hypothetical protein
VFAMTVANLLRARSGSFGSVHTHSKCELANQNCATEQKRTLKMHVSRATLRRLEGTGATVTTGLDVKPGSHLVRAVVGSINE